MIVKKRCEYCEKTIEAFSAKQVDYLMDQHILSKHREKLKEAISKGEK